MNLDNEQKIPAEVLEEVDRDDEGTEGIDDIGLDPDQDFDYDENGDIIIPKETSDEDTEDGEESGEDADDGESADETETETETEPEAAEPEAEDATDTVDAIRKENEALREKYRRLEFQSKDTLKKLGVDVKDEDVLKGLESLAAEAVDKPHDEYSKAQDEEYERAKFAEQLRQQRYEEVYRADLAELQANYPDTKDFKTLRDMPENVYEQFSHYRSIGLNAKSAYAAANPDGIRKFTSDSMSRQAQHESKSHLQSSVPKSARDVSTPVSKKELAMYRDLFPKKTDKELINLIKRVNEK